MRRTRAARPRKGDIVVKEKFEELKLEVITFEAENIIVTSEGEDNEGPLNPDF